MTDNAVYEQAQASVIGSLLIDPEHVVGLVMRELDPSDFTGTHRTAFEAVRAVWSEGGRVDAVVVLSRMGSAYEGYLRECMEATPTAANVAAYAALVREQAALLALRGVGMQLAGAVDPEDARRILESAQALLAERQGLRGRPVWELMADFVQWLQDPAPPAYLPWGIRQLDEALTAEGGDFVVLGADSSVGKTALAVQLAWAQASKGKRVGFASLETNALKLTRRLVAQRARVPMSGLKQKTVSDSQMADIIALGSAANKVPLIIYDAAGADVAALQAAAVADRLDVLYVDYVQLLSAPGRERWEIVTAISMALHTMAQRLGITVVGLSQITADGGKKAKTKPGKDDLRESRQLKQDADLILMLSLMDPEDNESLRWLRIEKNKDGALGSVCLRFDPEHMDFTATDSRALDSWRRKKTAPGKFTELPDNGQEEIPWQT